MKPTPLLCWGLARLLSNLPPLNGELDCLEGPGRRLFDHLASLPFGDRHLAFTGYLQSLSPEEQAAFEQGVDDADPLGPLPTASGPQFATASDITRMAAGIRWRWDGWIPDAKVIGVAALEGTGKTRFCLDLCRRAWHGLPWPDNQPMTVTEGTPSLWLPADGNHDEIAATLTDFGMPGEAVVFPAPPNEPYGNTDLDVDETWTALNDAIVTAKPWCVFIDSLTNATTFNLCEQQTIARLKSPLVDIVQRHQVNVVLLLHVSKEGQALGRRIKGVTRTLIHLEAPDPEQPDRLRLWTEKSFAKRPPPLGVTIMGTGNDYDFNPPVKPDPNKGGRPADKRDRATQFIRDALAKDNDQLATDLCRDWEATGESKKTFWRAVDDLADGGELFKDGGPGTGKQIMLHLRPKPQNP